MTHNTNTNNKTYMQTGTVYMYVVCARVLLFTQYQNVVRTCKHTSGMQQKRTGKQDEINL